MNYRLQTFTVHGTGPFPLDMLRFEGCWPREGRDSAIMAENGTRDIHLARYVTTLKDLPTSERWASFGWIVLDDVETRR